MRLDKLEREAQKILEARRELSQRFFYDYGGWSSGTYITYDDLSNDGVSKKRRTLRLNDTRVWASLNVEDIHNVYVRARVAYNDWLRGDEYRRREDDLNVDLDQAFYTLDFRNALKTYFDTSMPFRLKLKGGRFRSYIGNGLAYSRLALGLQLEGRSRYVDFKAIWFRTPHGETNADYSVPGFRTEGQRRFFYGIEISYPGFNRHTPYFYFLNQKDRTTLEPHDPENLPDDLNQKYHYDSKYIGLGSSGYIIKNLNYEIEAVREIGRSYAEGSSTVPASREDISAWALNAELEKVVEVVTHPTFRVQYAFGTGDKDRDGVTNTVESGDNTGNKPNTKDRNFLYFGYLDTGTNLAPKLSNLHMFHLAAEVKPLEFTRNFKETVGLSFDYYFFRKHRKEGGIFDFRADRRLTNVGREAGVTVTWNILSDLSLFVNYSRFYPGHAFSEKNARDYVIASLNWQF
ncbi:MAG: hypothetical protein ACE5KK_03585 [Candidatus Brocadiales bacterium]